MNIFLFVETPGERWKYKITSTGKWIIIVRCMEAHLSALIAWVVFLCVVCAWDTEEKWEKKDVFLPSFLTHKLSEEWIRKTFLM